MSFFTKNMKLYRSLKAALLPGICTSILLASCASTNTYQDQRNALISLASNRDTLIANAKKSKEEVQKEVTKMNSSTSSMMTATQSVAITTHQTTEKTNNSKYDLDKLFKDYILYVVDNFSGLVFKRTGGHRIQLIDKDKEILDGGNLTKHTHHDHNHMHNHEHEHEEHHDEEETEVVGRALSFTNGIFLVIDYKKDSERKNMSGSTTMMHQHHHEAEEHKEERKLSLNLKAYKFNTPFNISEFISAWHHKESHNSDTEFNNLHNKYGKEELDIIDYNFEEKTVDETIA